MSEMCTRAVTGLLGSLNEIKGVDRSGSLSKIGVDGPRFDPAQERRFPNRATTRHRSHPAQRPRRGWSDDSGVDGKVQNRRATVTGDTLPEGEGLWPRTYSPSSKGRDSSNRVTGTCKPRSISSVSQATFHLIYLLTDWYREG